MHGRIASLVTFGLMLSVVAVWGATTSDAGGGLALLQPSDPYMGQLTPSGNADSAGMFSGVMPWSLVSIHATVARSGEIVTYGSPLGKGQQGAFQFDNWNPSTNDHVQSAPLVVDSFCNLNIATTNGKLMMAGGNSQFTSGLYDTATQKYSSLPRFAYPRWYASMIRLPDNRFVVMGGAEPKAAVGEVETRFSSTPEILSPGASAWVPLPGAKSVSLFGSPDYAWWYPKAYLAPSGNVFGISQDRMWVLDPDGTGAVTDVGGVPGTGFGSSASSVMYAPGKILLAGGGQHINNDRLPGSRQASIIDIATDSPTAVATNQMARPRNWLNLTVLPNGEVLATGGTEVGIEGTPAYSTEIWNPDTKTWRTGASAQRIRTYHSTALLMPSGAVFTSGGGAPGPVTNLDTELYYPPQLFGRDTSGKVVWADRPEFRSVSGVIARGNSATFAMKDNRPLQSVSLTSAGSVTHAYNSDQRRIPLTFTQSGSDVTVGFPADETMVPPGVYLLNAVDAAGVPAPSQIIEIMADNAPGLITVYGSGTQVPPVLPPTSTTTTQPPVTTTTTQPPVTTTTTQPPVTTTTTQPPVTTTTTQPPVTTTTTTTPPPYSPPSSGQSFVSLMPARLADTRSSGVKAGSVDGSAGAFELNVLGRGGLPGSGVGAVALNVTAANGEDPIVGGGYVTVYQCGARPDASNLNFTAGETIPNAVIAPVSASGDVCFYVYGRAHLIVDVSGYFPTGSGFVSLMPARLADTRSSGVKAGSVDGSAGAFELNVLGRGGLPGSGVGAVALNVTAANGEDPIVGGGYVTVYQCGARPDASNLNFMAGETIPNAVIAPVSASGDVCFYVYGRAHLIVDVSGYFSV